MEKHLHIIDFTVPYPVNYGGVVDLFWKLPALQQEGVQIHLHCFDYGRGEQHELNKYCATVKYYHRKTGISGFSFNYPYIVSSRQNEELYKELLKDEYPIFMEGIQSTLLLSDKRFANRKKFVRVHNVEFEYYHDLSNSTNSFYKKLYYKYESKQLRKYEEAIVPKATAFWSVTEKDAETYRNQLGCSTIEHLPLYLPEDWKVNCLEGKGYYCLYQGDLSVAANEKAAKWLLEQVFNKIEVPFVIAGKNPSPELMHQAHMHQHTCIVANPSDEEMKDMIHKSHINILPSFSNSGIKLKLLNALFNGRFCIANNATVEGSDVEQLCTIANTAEEFIEKITHLNETEFSAKEIESRKALLQVMFNNKKNAQQQVKWIWS